MFIALCVNEKLPSSYLTPLTYMYSSVNDTKGMSCLKPCATLHWIFKGTSAVKIGKMEEKDQSFCQHLCKEWRTEGKVFDKDHFEEDMEF